MEIITHSKIGHGATGFVFSKIGAKKLFKSLKSYSQAYDTHIGIYWKYNLYIVALADSLIKPSGCESDIGSRPVGKSSKKLGLIPYIRRFIARMKSIFMRRLWGYFVIPSHIKIIIK